MSLCLTVVRPSLPLQYGFLHISEIIHEGEEHIKKETGQVIESGPKRDGSFIMHAKVGIFSLSYASMPSFLASVLFIDPYLHNFNNILVCLVFLVIAASIQYPKNQHQITELVKTLTTQFH